MSIISGRKGAGRDCLVPGELPGLGFRCWVPVLLLYPCPCPAQLPARKGADRTMIFLPREAEVRVFCRLFFPTFSPLPSRRGGECKMLILRLPYGEEKLQQIPANSLTLFLSLSFSLLHDCYLHFQHKGEREGFWTRGTNRANGAKWVHVEWGLLIVLCL